MKELLNNILKKWGDVVHLCIVIPMFILCALAFGITLTPAVMFVKWVMEQTTDQSLFVHSLSFALSLGAAFYIFAFTLILVLPFLNLVLFATPKPWRGPYYSIKVLPWYIHNGLTYLARFTVLEFMTPSPFNNLFYRLMRMKVGRHTQINSSHISDPALVVLGDEVTVGGSVSILAHYGQGGYLVLTPTVIEDKVTLGLKCSIMGGVHIGKGAKVLPHSVVLPKTKIGAGEIWAGVPAKKLTQEEIDGLKNQRD